ncbi:MAG TPA: metallopeptidase TldD-related protein [Planctomycetota bacterium]|nr:metallopeptidase TldD-related protein [Planctomycetota bacterium]
MRRTPILVACALLLPASLLAAQGGSAKPVDHPLLATMAHEIEFGMANLKSPDDVKPYFLAFTVTDTATVNIQARLGALQTSDTSRARILDTDLRVGNYALDSTHQIRGGRGGGFGRAFGGGVSAIALDDDPAAIRQALWKATDASFNTAVERYQQVQTNLKTMVKEESPADDFTQETPSVYSEPDAKLGIDRNVWIARTKKVSEIALKEPLIESSSVTLVGSAENRYMASSEGSRLKTGRKLLRVVLSASSKADDGMDLGQTFIFDAATEDRLPTEEQMAKEMRKVIDEVLALRAAPLVEPYTGPAILLNRASGVFFHEIFGHRIEGHRQKTEDEGQTFTKMVGQPVLPSFLSVVDDPTLARLGDQDLRGFYRYDDEGVPAQRVSLVDKGELKTFLMSRSPVSGFTKSNGHGRREPGRDAVSRQGNLMAISSNAVPFAKLREKLVELCKKQGKPFGLLFDDISGGFTTTSRGGPQAFKVQPIVVYRIFADGKPDELVRGVDIVGTPLSCFSKIVATGDDTAVFNGSCGAESGWVPVTAISPSILVEQIEIEKKARSSERPPLLATPIGSKAPRPTDASTGATSDALALALADEMGRGPELKLPGIDGPYYVEYRVTERQSHSMAASLGSLVRSEPSKSRTLRTDVRVGSYELDNSNFNPNGGGGGPFGGGGGGRRGGFGGGDTVSLPEEDDYVAIRQAAWLATDTAYKNAVEALTQKKAYLEGRAKEDRPADFARSEPVVAIGKSAAFAFDASPWEAELRRVSARFQQHKDVVDSGVELQAHADTETFLNTEGTRERFAAPRATLTLHAEVMADDGERISDRIVHVAETAADLPKEDRLLADVDELAKRLVALKSASRMKEYAGPVMFEGIAAPQLFSSLLARGLAAQPSEAGGGRRRVSDGDALEKLMGKRILPASFHLFDDPRPAKCDGKYLSGHYDFDDDGVAPQKVDLVTGGKLVGFVSSRTPTESVATSNGHGRSGRAVIGCLYVESSEALAADALTKKLLATAKDQGLKHALVVRSLSPATQGGFAAAFRARGRGGRGGGGGGAQGGPGRAPGGLPDPLLVSKVFVDDGHEEAIRGCEFDAVTINSLKDVLAAGDKPTVWNSTGAPATSIVAPAVILETVNVYGAEGGNEKKPALPAPSMR